MSTVATEPRHEIYEIAQLCLESFSVYLLQKRPRHEVIKEEQQRFWAWSNALKVFANDQICLDAQLRGTRYDEIRRLVVSLLRVLNQNLSLALKSGPATETSIYQMGTLGNENVNLNDVPTDSAFELALFGINGSLKRLEKFAAAILQATQGSLARRVSAFAQENHDEEVERYINFMITYRFQVFGRDGKSTSTLPPKMREILFDSSVYRHYRLKRLRTKTIPERRQLRRNVGTKPPSNMEDAVTISRVEHEDHPKKLSPQKLEKGAQSEYQTLPLTVNTRDFKKNLVETQSNPQQINKVSVSEMGMPEFPPPPRPLNGEECCTCPFCGENFAIGDLEGYKWKVHVSKDLQPYVCVSEDCSKNLQFFNDKASWLKHMESTHTAFWIRYLPSTIRWKCPIGHYGSPLYFNSEEELAQHITTAHSEIEQVEAQHLASSSAIPQHRPVDTCPMCGDKHLPHRPQDPAPGSNQIDIGTSQDAEDHARIAKHIGEHLFAFALFFSRHFLDDPPNHQNLSSYSGGVESRIGELEREQGPIHNEDPPKFPPKPDGDSWTDDEISLFERELQGIRDVWEWNHTGRVVELPTLTADDILNYWPERDSRKKPDVIWRGIHPRGALELISHILIILELCENRLTETNRGPIISSKELNDPLGIFQEALLRRARPDLNSGLASKYVLALEGFASETEAIVLRYMDIAKNHVSYRDNASERYRKSFGDLGREVHHLRDNLNFTVGLASVECEMHNFTKHDDGAEAHGTGPFKDQVSAIILSLSDNLSDTHNVVKIQVESIKQVRSIAEVSSALADSLFNALIESPNRNRSFLPINRLEELITTIAVERELRGLILGEALHRQAQIIREYAPKLFAILTLLDHPGYIIQLLEARIFDSDLPFQKSIDGSMLCSHQRTDMPIKCTAYWGVLFLQTFRRYQWSVMAPIFRYSEDMKLNDLDYNCVMPFIRDMEMSEHVAEGEHATVWEVVIHPAHQYLLKSQNAQPSIALKRLHSISEEDFFLEVEMLKALNRHRDPHFVKLLATYKYQGRFYLVFSYGKGNLRTYWKSHPVPEFSQVVITWMIKQCKGLSSALLRIHGYRTTWDFKTSTKGSSPLTHDETLYGVHGGIQPEEILWTDEDVSGTDPKPCEEGLLMIADFRLMRVRRGITKSQTDPYKVTGPPIYEAPELRLQSKVSRAYDIWSMGCVFLEFITWLVGGWNDLKRLRSSRIMTGIEEPNDDMYFRIVDNEILGVRAAVVRESVKDWISGLHNNTRSSQFVHDFLDIISNDMLVVRPEYRIQCGKLIEELSKMLDKAAADASYILEPAFSQQRRESLSHKATANAAYILEPTFSPQHQWSLLEKLENARHYWPIPRTDADTYFIPRDCIENLLTFEAVNDQLHRAYPGESEAWISSLTKSICLSAKRLFIILLCGGQIDSSHYIHEFIEEGITDADLPFTKYFLQKEYQTSGGNYKSVVCKKSHLTCSKKDHADCGIKALMRAGRRLDFVRRDQWIVLAPIFRPALDNTTPEMNINTIMPFIKDNEHDITLKKEGGYGEVWQVVIHPAHQRFSQVQHVYAKEAKIAIKRQYSTNASKFQVERDMLTTLAKKNHPHLIRLLTTYKFRNRYHFMFLWADSNLVDYWESRRLPERTPQVYLWVLEQMIGITSALSTIHNYKSSALRNQEPKVKYKEYSTAGSLQQEEVNNRFPALEEEADYGRHGDLKGQNILWFDGPNGGTLQISDLGTGRFHGLESRSNVNPNTISGSPTYSPPEVVLNKFVSRKYDIWSLGCVYSEFITWLIEGPEGIQNFADARLLYTDPNWADDKFFVLVNNIESGATLRPRVLDWFSRLRSNKRCSPMLSELLTLIQQRMLSIDSNNRISSEELLEQLEHIRIRANDVAYAI